MLQMDSDEGNELSYVNDWVARVSLRGSPPSQLRELLGLGIGFYDVIFLPVFNLVYVL